MDKDIKATVIKSGSVFYTLETGRGEARLPKELFSEELKEGETVYIFTSRNSSAQKIKLLNDLLKGND